MIHIFIFRTEKAIAVGTIIACIAAVTSIASAVSGIINDIENTKASQSKECSFTYLNEFSVNDDKLQMQLKCMKKCKNQIELIDHAQTCPLRYKAKFSQSNPGLLAKLAWENAISNGYADYLYHEIQKSLLSNRKISNLVVDTHATTVKNVRLVKSPNFKDYFIIHKEPYDKKRKNRDECEITENIFRKLIPTSSPVKQYGETNKVRPKHPKYKFLNYLNYYFIIKLF